MFCKAVFLAVAKIKKASAMQKSAWTGNEGGHVQSGSKTGEAVKCSKGTYPISKSSWLFKNEVKVFFFSHFCVLSCDINM